MDKDCRELGEGRVRGQYSLHTCSNLIKNELN